MMYQSPVAVKFSADMTLKSQGSALTSLPVCATEGGQPCTGGGVRDLAVGFCAAGIENAEQLNGESLQLVCDNGQPVFQLSECHEGGAFTCPENTVKASCILADIDCTALNSGPCPNNNLAGLAIVQDERLFGCESFQNFEQ